MSNNNPANKPWFQSVLIAAFVVLACFGCNRDREPDQNEYAAVKAALDDFTRDWGLPVAASRPTECRLVDHFRPVDQYEREALRAKLSADIQPVAQQLEAKRAGVTLPEMMTNCKLVHDTSAMGDPWAELRTRPDSRVGILQVSRVGFDRGKGTAVLVLNESRALLAGTTFVVVLHRAGSYWTVRDRVALSRS